MALRLEKKFWIGSLLLYILLPLSVVDTAFSQPTIGFETSELDVDESIGAVRVAVTLSEAPTTATTVHVASAGDTAVPGQDFYGLFQQIEFVAGESRQEFNVFVLEDDITEDTENLTLRLFLLQEDQGAYVLDDEATKLRLSIVDNDSSGWIRVEDENVTVGPVFGRLLFEHNSRPAGIRAKCGTTHFAQVDPLVSPGRRSHHLHEFFGAGTVDDRITTQELFDAPADTISCDKPNDKSGYWVPAVFQDGERITSSDLSAYYRPHRNGPTNPMPLGLRMLAGKADAKSQRDNPNVFWDDHEGGRSENRDEMITADPNRGILSLRVFFPDCWDGEHLDSPDHRSHVAYSDRSDICPSSHPVPILKLNTWLTYETEGGNGFKLASGEWYTGHMDFWNAWHPDMMQAIVDNCMVRQCASHGVRPGDQGLFRLP